MPKQWDEYLKSKGEKVVIESVSWDKVRFLGGTEDGDFFSLFFDIDGVKVELECGDAQLEDPKWVIRKLIFRSRKLIDCPYNTQRSRQNWMPAVVLKWLQSMDIIHVKRENLVDSARDAIIDFALRPLDYEVLTKPWDQIKDPIKKDNRVYIPFTGLSRYVTHITGRDLSRNFLTSALSQIGAQRTRQGKGNKVFYCIPYENLISQSSETGVGKDDRASEGSEDVSFSGWDGSPIDVREEERDATEGENGMVKRRYKKTADDPDVTLSGLASLETEKRNKPDEIPF
jgi:hypothetical protein